MANVKRIEEAMRCFQSGDKKGFNTLYEETNRLVFYQIFSVIKDHALTEDIMQEVYITVYEKPDAYKGGSVLAWIQTIARNLAINAYNKRKRLHLVSDEAILDRVADHDDPSTPLIDMARQRLEEDEFMIVMLCVVEGYKRREVANLLNLSTSGVTWKLNQALDKLKEELRKE